MAPRDRHRWPVEQTLRLLVDSTVDYAIFMLDVDGTILTWNAGAEQVKGYQPAEIIGRHFSVFYPPEAVAARHPEFELELAARDGRYEEDGWRVRKDGSQFWASVTITALRDSEGTLHGFGKVTRDLTGRKRHEDALRLAEEQFRLAFDAAPAGMALMALDGRWLRVNDAMSRITGYGRQALLELTLQQLLDTAESDVDLQRVEEDLRAETPGFGTDARIVRGDGARVWVRLNVGLVTDSAGQPQHFVVQLEDITDRTTAARDRERAMAEYAAANAALLQAEQAKSHFLAVASHELRSPLTAILGFAETIVRRWDRIDDERKQESVRTIERQARRLRILVEDLLTLSTMDAGGLTIHAREVTVRDAVEESVVSLSAPVELIGDLDTTVYADPLRLSQILTNLLVNAAKYGRPPIELGVRRDAHEVVLWVRDHGDGVPEDFVPRLFGRFTQADEGLRRRSQGTGLGLAICLALAHAHGGDLSYSAAEGGGSCFTVRLPAHRRHGGEQTGD